MSLTCVASVAAEGLSEGGKAIETIGLIVAVLATAAFFVVVAVHYARHGDQVGEGTEPSRPPSDADTFQGDVRELAEERARSWR